MDDDEAAFDERLKKLAKATPKMDRWTPDDVFHSLQRKMERAHRELDGLAGNADTGPFHQTQAARAEASAQVYASLSTCPRETRTEFIEHLKGSLASPPSAEDGIDQALLTSVWVETINGLVKDYGDPRT
jgi:hypothetical protein